jgi:DNA-binding MarR family transcriptional regulator
VTTVSGPEDIGVLLSRATAAFKDGLHTQLADAGYADVGPSYGVVLRALGERAHSLAELAARLDITPQGALKTVAEMIERGYVERGQDPADQRVRLLSLTARGRAVLREARRVHAKVEQDLARQLGAKAVAATREVLSALAGDSAPEGTRDRGLRPF